MSSISRMEKFSSCAFAHFLTYGLRLKERSEYEFQALDLGNVFHTAIEKYSKKLKEQRLQWTGVPEDSRKKLVRDCVEEAVTDYGNSVLYASHRSEYMVKRLERLLDRTVWALTDQLKKGDFIPEAYEMTFGSGKIDRIDLCHENDELYVKVMDYKTGRTGFDISAFYHGLQLQLMVYMNAAIDVMKQRYPACTVIPSGVFYYKIDDPFVEKSSDAYEEKLLKELRLDGIVNLKGNSLGHLDRTLKGTSTVVPVRLNKDGSLAKSSKAVSEDAFDTMLSYAKEKSKRVSEQIRQGEISVNPYENGQMTGCDYCRYQHICGFHPEISGFAYRELVKLSQEEAIIKMRQDMGREEH